jgi:uncharacterized protein YkwD
MALQTFVLIALAILSAQSSKPNVQPENLEKQIFQMINAQREKNHLPALQTDQRLSSIARSHSEDMASHDYFAHEDQQGRSPDQRAQAAGYTCRVKVGQRYSGLGENLAQGNLAKGATTTNGKTTYDWNSEEQIAATAVNNWMQSSGHRRNILDPVYTKTGIGVAIAKDGKVYITQNFC